MIKRFTGALLGALIATQGISVFAAAEFSDLTSSHWAYSQVDTLVKEGTISGYEDGSFKPDNTVTRAEFVKMIGKGNTVYNGQFPDVSADHWGYDYIMTSGLAPVNGNFEPDRPITRGETIDVLWNRAGAPENVPAPEFIKNQGDNKNALAWIYTYGIVVGNDGVDLRLGDTLTRAEAAALIIKSRGASEMINFTENVSDNVAAVIAESLDVFEKSYSPDDKITNGEMARAALRIATGEHQLSYYDFDTSAPFEHEYAKDLQAISSISDIGADKITAEFADKNATVDDALSMLIGAFGYRSGSTFNFDKASYAYGGITGSEEITRKQAVCTIMNFDEICGTQASFTVSTTDGSFKKANITINKFIETYPKNANQYKVIVNTVPNEVYEYTKPVDTTEDDFAVWFPDFLALQSSKLINAAKQAYGVDMNITFYPALVYDNGKGFVMRIKCTIINAPENLTVSDLFDNPITNKDAALKSGLEFFAEYDMKTYEIYN